MLLVQLLARRGDGAQRKGGLQHISGTAVGQKTYKLTTRAKPMAGAHTTQTVCKATFPCQPPARAAEYEAPHPDRDRDDVRDLTERVWREAIQT